VFLSVATTTSKSIYTACAEKITKGYRGRRWRSILFAGLLAGLAACLLGIVGISGAELAIGKEPSISPNGAQVIPISPSPAMGEEPSISPNGTQGIPSSPPPPPPLISYYYDSDGDGFGSGDPVKYERGSQPFGWVEQSGDKCPDRPGSVELQGCPEPIIRTVPVTVRVLDTPAGLTISADGVVVLDRFAQPGFSQTFDVQRVLTVSTGNAGSVEVEVGGQNLGRLGRNGLGATRDFPVQPPS